MYIIFIYSYPNKLYPSVYWTTESKEIKKTKLMYIKIVFKIFIFSYKYIIQKENKKSKKKQTCWQWMISIFW